MSTLLQDILQQTDCKKTHQNLHERKGRIDCNNCEKTFASSFALSYHVKKHHTAGLKIKCDKCEETFQDFQVYTDHGRNTDPLYLSPNVISTMQDFLLKAT